MDIAKMQFSQGAFSIPYNVKAQVNMLGSSAAKKSSLHTARTAPKISGVAIAISKLINQAVSAIVVRDGFIYCEIKREDGNSDAYYYEEDSLHYHYPPNKPLSPYNDLIPFILHTLNFTDIFHETNASFSELKDSIDKGSADIDTIAYACDCFYFETKIAYSTAPGVTVPLTKETINRVQQYINNGDYHPIDTMFDIGQSFVCVNINGAKQSQSPGRDRCDSVFFDDCKAFRYELGWNWNAEQQKRTPSIDILNEFVPNAAYQVMTMVAHNRLSSVIERLDGGSPDTEAIKNDYMNVILVGKPGTGKTTTAKALAATLGVPLYTVPLSKYTEEDEFEGKTKVAEGGYRFFPTSFLQAYKTGGVAVLEEFNLADPAVMQGAIGQAIEAPFVLMEDGHVEIHRHPLFVVIMTMNTATQGSREPNEAFTSRAPLTLVMDDPDKEEFVSILVNKGNSKKNAAKVYGIYTKILKFLKNESAGEDIMASLTIRHCIEALYLMKLGLDCKSAIRNTLVGTLAIKDIDLSSRVYEAVVETMKE
jgi:hypothetical protein